MNLLVFYWQSDWAAVFHWSRALLVFDSSSFLIRKNAWNKINLDEIIGFMSRNICTIVERMRLLQLTMLVYFFPQNVIENLAVYFAAVAELHRDAGGGALLERICVRDAALLRPVHLVSAERSAICKAQRGNRRVCEETLIIHAALLEALCCRVVPGHPLQLRWVELCRRPSESTGLQLSDASKKQLLSASTSHLTSCLLLPPGEMAFPQYTGRVADWIMNEEAPDPFTEAITVMTLMTMARWANLYHKVIKVSPVVVVFSHNIWLLLFFLIRVVSFFFFLFSIRFHLASLKYSNSKFCKMHLER